MKKLLVIFLSVLLVISFSLSVGCKRAEEPMAPPAEEAAPEAPAPAPEAEEAPAPEGH